MKDPLDMRDDPYQAFNDEGAHQGKTLFINQSTPPMEIRRIFGQLRGRANNPSQLEEARNHLTKTEYRLWADIFYYVLDGEIEVGKPLEEPLWEWEKALVPELVEPSRLIKLVLGDEEQLLPPIQYLEVDIQPMPQYDQVYTPEWNITFPK